MERLGLSILSDNRINWDIFRNVGRMWFSSEWVVEPPVSITIYKCLRRFDFEAILRSAAALLKRLFPLPCLNVTDRLEYLLFMPGLYVVLSPTLNIRWTVAEDDYCFSSKQPSGYVVLTDGCPLNQSADGINSYLWTASGSSPEALALLICRVGYEHGDILWRIVYDNQNNTSYRDKARLSIVTDVLGINWGKKLSTRE